MNHDTSLRDLERAYQADPSNAILGERYYTALLRQGHIQEAAIDSGQYPFHWNDCVVLTGHNNNELRSTQQYKGLHCSGRSVVILIRRPSDYDSISEIRELEQLKKLLIKSVEIPNLITPIDCGQIADHYFLINEDPVPGQLLATADLSEDKASEIAARLTALTGPISAAASLDLCPPVFSPSRNLYLDSHRSLSLRISGKSLFEEMERRIIENMRLAPREDAGWDNNILCYQSPEHIMGEPIDERSWVFQLGIVLYEQLTGSRPFSGETLRAILRAIMRSQPTPPGALRVDITKAVSDVCMTALEKEPENRYKSLGAFAKALSQATVAST